MAESERDAFGDVPFAPVGSAEGHRRGRVEQEPRLDGALGDVDADVRLAGAGGHVPVDQADVVAGDVGAHLGQLGTIAERPGAVIAGEQPVDPGPNDEVHLAQQCRGQRAGAGTARRARRAEGWAVLMRPPPGQVEVGHRDRLEHTVEDLVGVDAFGERLVAEHHPMAQHVLGELAHVLREHVAAAAQEGKGAGAERRG